MKHNVVYVFVILVDDVYCVAIHDLSPVLTALFSIELGGFNRLTKLQFFLVRGVFIQTLSSLKLFFQRNHVQEEEF